MPSLLDRLAVALALRTFYSSLNQMNTPTKVSYYIMFWTWVLNHPHGEYAVYFTRNGIVYYILLLWKPLKWKTIRVPLTYQNYEKRAVWYMHC
jgi:hypothetical protein